MVFVCYVDCFVIMGERIVFVVEIIGINVNFKNVFFFNFNFIFLD